MEFDFETVVDRRNTRSVKWDQAKTEDEIPLWVADMDFPTVPAVTRALIKRATHGLFGYTEVPDAFYEATIGWFARRHGITYRKEWLIYTTGVVPALSAIIQALTEPGDGVIVQEPVYNCFFSSIRNNRCKVLSNDLIYRDGTCTIDFDDLEKKARRPEAKLMLLCNPHNPTGRVWKKEELQQIGEICFRNNVLVVSDEIHCDLVYEPHRHTPFPSLGQEFLEKSVTCVAPGKTFNLAGLHVANMIAFDPEIRNRIDRSINVNEVCELNPFAVEGLIAAYTEGDGWLDELKKVLYTNYLTVKEFFQTHLPWIALLPLEGTYLVWIDCSRLNLSSEEIGERLLREGRIRVNHGALYGKAGEGFIRINVACPRSTLNEALPRIRNVLEKIPVSPEPGKEYHSRAK